MSAIGHRLRLRGYGIEQGLDVLDDRHNRGFGAVHNQEAAGEDAGSSETDTT
jgi:hypothetical protein